ncbi:MAG: glycerol-3-phosphate dehydrogenase subunit GlpB [Thermodesulfobacteriota bacterium]
MKYDALIIGGGLAGLTCGLKCQAEGLSCAVISAGMSALHFSSGSIDLWGRRPGGGTVRAPWRELPDLLAGRPGHPYAKCPDGLIKEALSFLQAQAAAGGLSLYANGRENHFHVTTLGTLKPTYLSSRSVFNERLKAAYLSHPRVAILNFAGFRDFHPALAAAGLARHPMFRRSKIVTGTLRLPEPRRFERPAVELRSIDLARLFDRPGALERTAARIKDAAGDAEVVGLPATLGLTRYHQALETLERLTGLLICEIPTLPPSILGLRLDDALKNRFAALGGVYIAGDRVTGGEMTGGRLDHVHTKARGRERLEAGCFVLATGSFFSGGLESRFHRVSEPVFGLALEAEEGRMSWSDREFFPPRGHPFLSYGVRTDERLRPFDARGDVVENLYCAGAVLAGYDPVLEGSGGGVAVATGYLAALGVLGRSPR